jgi:uncharacterized protein (TIGR00255 family)
MIRSMTGYGKSEVELPSGKLTLEIRTLNGKTADISLKTQLLPKDKELEVRARVASRLTRGTIDVFLSYEPNAAEGSRQLDLDAARSYISQASVLAKEMGVQYSPSNSAILLNAVLGLPNLVESRKADVITEDNWPEVSAAIDSCLDMVDDYRSREGEALYRDVTSRVGKILELYNGVESHESERLDAVRARILKAAAEMSLKLDKERFEQEMIFYLEKLDINEEKVRLRQHCKYFMDTIDSEPYPGKKLGFIIQEMGREINTTGSKANHAEIQKLVVQMKDELEKIREQSMNIL